MTCIAFVGATSYEMQIGRLWVTFLRPKYWCRRATFMRWGWDTSEDEDE